MLYRRRSTKSTGPSTVYLKVISKNQSKPPTCTNANPDRSNKTSGHAANLSSTVMRVYVVIMQRYESGRFWYTSTHVMWTQCDHGKVAAWRLCSRLSGDLIKAPRQCLQLFSFMLYTMASASPWMTMQDWEPRVSIDAWQGTNKIRGDVPCQQ